MKVESCKTTRGPRRVQRTTTRLVHLCANVLSSVKALVFLSQLSQESLVKRAGTPRSDRVWSACIDLAGMTYR